MIDRDSTANVIFRCDFELYPLPQAAQLVLMMVEPKGRFWLRYSVTSFSFLTSSTRLAKLISIHTLVQRSR